MRLEVILLGHPRFDVNQFLSFLQKRKAVWKRSSETNPPEELVEIAGRICYMSFGKNQSPKTNREYIQHLIEMGHESVLEHVNWTFLLAGISRAFTHQFVRHRVGFSFSQLSQQYHDETEAEFVEPSLIRKSAKSHAAWQRATRSVKQSYKELLASLTKIPLSDISNLEIKEVRRAIHSAARSVLPNATETKIVVTANARAWRHFFSVRGSIPGDEEMRLVASEVLRHLQAEAPAIFFDFRIGKLPDGSPIVIHEKVAST